MNRAELVDAVSAITGQTKQQTHDAVNAILHTITGTLSKGERVMLVGFGTFERRNRKARSGVNPQNPRQKLTIAAAKVPAFRAGQELKNIVDGKAKLPPAPKADGKDTKKSASKPAAKTTKKVAAKPVKKAAPAKKTAKKRK
jgi:DNA-binding protein HU-beta